MNRKYLISGILMLIMPMITLVQSLYIKNREYQKWTLIFFITIYGSVINLGSGTDGFVHQSNVNNYYTNIDFKKFLTDTFDIITFTTNYDVQEDLYIHFVSYFCASILGLPGIFFIIVAFVYGYFYAGSLFKIIKLSPNYKYSFLFYGFLTIFVLYKGLEGVNTVRTWTGLWILFYGVINYLETKKLKYLFLVLIPPYIHLGYFVMAIPAWFVLFVGNYSKVFSVLFIFSFTLNLLNPESITERLEQTEVGKEKVKSYYTEEQQTTEETLSNSRSKGSTWYKAYAKAGFHLLMINTIAFVILYRGYYPFKMTSVESDLFAIGILTKVLSSATWFLFALSNRSAAISSVFILAAFISMAQRGAFIKSGNKTMPKFETVSFQLIFIGLIPFIIFKISELGEFISLFMVSSPFIVWFVGDANISIKDAFKALISF